jgi:hypothetical protein
MELRCLRYFAAVVGSVALRWLQVEDWRYHQDYVCSQ